MFFGCWCRVGIRYSSVTAGIASRSIFPNANRVPTLDDALEVSLDLDKREREWRKQFTEEYEKFR